MNNENNSNESRRMVTIDIVKANQFAVGLLVGTTLVMLFFFFMIWPKAFNLATFKDLLSPTKVLLFVGAMMVGIVLHELIHGITFACFAPSGWKSISFGVIWKMLTPYCHCDEPISLRYYQKAALMPCVLLGIVPTMVAMYISSLWLLALGVFFIAAAAGDLWMAWLLTKEDPRCKVLDHPSEAGLYLYPPEDQVN